MPALRPAPPPLGLELFVYRFPAMRHVASSSAASWMSNAKQINSWKSWRQAGRLHQINEGEGVLARANVEAVSAGVRFCGQVQVLGPQGVSGLGSWGGVGWKGSGFTF